MVKTSAQQRGALRALRFAKKLRASAKSRIDAGLGPVLPTDDLQLFAMLAMRTDLDRESFGFVMALIELLALHLAGEDVDLDRWTPVSGLSMDEQLLLVVKGWSGANR